MELLLRIDATEGFTVRDESSGAQRSQGFPQKSVVLLGEAPGLVVVSKPPGMLTHPKKPGGPRTLWHLLQELLACDLAGGGTISFINRLDRETSGVVLVALGRETAAKLTKAMTCGEITKRYLCIAKGWPTCDYFDVDAPLIRAMPLGKSCVAVRRIAHTSGRPALTRFRVLARWEQPLPPKSAALWGERFSLLEALPVTGRTHQIRAHLYHAGHPLLGDKIYGPDERFYLDFIQKGWTESLIERLVLTHHALHCAEMAVTTGLFKGHWIAGLPSDLLNWLPNHKKRI